MTNTEIIQAIRNEIERLKEDILSKVHHYPIHRIKLLDDLLAFLSTFELEKPMNQEGLEEELNKWRHDHFNGERDGHFSGEYLTRTSQLDLASHFAEWQKEQDEKEQADLLTIVALDAAQRAKEQMLKEAVEGEVSAVILRENRDEVHYAITYPEGKSPHSITDKVRVIVLSKEE